MDRHAGLNTARRRPTAAEKALRKERVAAVKDVLSRSAALQGSHVTTARQALKAYLRNLDEPRQPDPAAFANLLDGPFRDPRARDRRS